MLFRVGIKDYFRKNKKNKKQENVSRWLILFNKNNNISSSSFELLDHAPLFKIK